MFPNNCSIPQKNLHKPDFIIFLFPINNRTLVNMPNSLLMCFIVYCVVINNEEHMYIKI